MVRLLTGLLLLIGVATLAALALGTRGHGEPDHGSRALVHLGGLPEPDGPPAQLRVLVLDAGRLHHLPAWNEASRAQAADAAVRHLAAQLRIRRPDILIAYDWPLAGTATFGSPALQTLAVHTELPWQAWAALHDRRLVPAPFAGPDRRTASVRAGTVVLSRFPVEHVELLRHDWTPNHGLAERLWGSAPGTLIVHLRVGEADQTLAVHVADGIPLADERFHAPGADLLASRTGPTTAPDLPHAPDRLRNAARTLVLAAPGWRPMVSDGDRDLDGQLPTPFLLTELERTPPPTPATQGPP